MSSQRWVNDDPNLKDFERLGVHTYLRHPQALSDSASSSSPDLVILCTWMGATTRPIAKYAAGHATLSPGSPILLIRSSLPDIILRSTNAQISRMAEAAEMVKNHIDHIVENGRTPKVLLHVFSNGGSWSACVLKEAYVKITHDPLPISAMVIDSAPSFPRVTQGYNAMMQCIPRSFLVKLLASFYIWVLISISYILDKLHLNKSVILKLRSMLNDRDGPFLNQTAPRTYICSKQDDMVPMEDVVLHADEARQIIKASGVSGTEQHITLEEFVGSKHVGHMMVDPTRYWKIINETWLKVETGGSGNKKNA